MLYVTQYRFDNSCLCLTKSIYEWQSTASPCFSIGVEMLGRNDNDENPTPLRKELYSEVKLKGNWGEWRSPTFLNQRHSLYKFI